jgi:hypothetical protein
VDGSPARAYAGERLANASDLIRAIDAAELSAREAYGEVETPRMHARIEAAWARLVEMLE